MTSPLPHSTSDTARLMADPPGFGVGWQQPLYLKNPVAGAEWSHLVDGTYVERLISAKWTLTTSAAVANRFGRLALFDQNNVEVISVQATGVVTANNSLVINLFSRLGMLSNAAGGFSWGTLPNILVPGGWTWKPVTAALDVADTETNIVLVVQQFPNDAAMITAGE